MAEVDREFCRKAAAECVELARVTSDASRKEILLIRSQEWLKLAYARHEAEFERLLADLNAGQMRHTPQRAQPQPRQQQQSRQKPDDMPS